VFSILEAFSSLENHLENAAVIYRERNLFYIYGRERFRVFDKNGLIDPVNDALAYTADCQGTVDAHAPVMGQFFLYLHRCPCSDTGTLQPAAEVPQRCRIEYLCTAHESRHIMVSN
jgi:hypothetical protein